ncbi:MAG: hypothetical protein ACK4X1_16950, partial [Terricaulis sp.]
MLRNTRRAGFLACAILLAACASQSADNAQTAQEDQIVTTGTRTERQDFESALPVTTPDQRVLPMAPPPPPPSRARAALSGIVGGTYAQSAPQPMPGTVDRENYEDVDTNPIR